MKKSILTRGLGVTTAAVMCLALLSTAALAESKYDGYELKPGINVLDDVFVTFIDPDGTVTSLTIPDGITRIEDYAFSGYGGGLEEIILPNGVTYIGASSFSWTSIPTISLPSSVTTIGEGAFTHCEKLTGIAIPDSVTNMDYGVFMYCPSLKDVTIGSGLKMIPQCAFLGCTSLTDITIPGTVQTIGSGAFSECTGLTSVTMEAGVTTIEAYAFQNCKSLTSVTIPDSVTSIDDFQVFDETLGGPYTRRLPNVTIYANSGSYAETYAKEQGIPFVSTGNASTPVTPTAPTDPTTPTDPVVPVTPPAGDQPSSWAEAQVNGAIAANLVPQDLQAQYTQPTTRAEFCALAAALYEVATGAEITGRTAFTDTLDENVQKMAALGVVSGVGDGRFNPDGKLTREQAATMLSRLASALGKPLTAQAPAFADNASISAWALDAVGQVQAAGIMGGVGDNAFAPQGDYTREQSILTIGRLFELVK